MLDSQDVLAELDLRGALLPPQARAAFAAACASRLARSRANAEATSFAQEWFGLLATLWQALLSNDLAGSHRVQAAVAALSFDALPSEADDDDVAACIYAAQAFCATDGRAWRWSATRLVDHAFSLATASLPPSSLPESDQFAKEQATPFVQTELERLISGLSLLETHAPMPSTYKQLQQLFLAA